MRRKLFKSIKNKLVIGVCGGIAEFFNISPIMVRLIFVFLCLFKGLGVLIYFLGYLFMPERPKLKIVKNDHYYSKDL